MTQRKIYIASINYQYESFSEVQKTISKYAFSDKEKAQSDAQRIVEKLKNIDGLFNVNTKSIVTSIIDFELDPDL